MFPSRLPLPPRVLPSKLSVPYPPLPPRPSRRPQATPHRHLREARYGITLFPSLLHVKSKLTPNKKKKQSQLSPRSLFRAMPFLVRLRSPRSDLLSLSCTSGAPRTHAVLNRAQFHKAPQPLTYSRTLACTDGVNAELLLRFARNELFERAQQANRHVSALVDEEYVLLFFFFRSCSASPGGSIPHEADFLNTHSIGGSIRFGRRRAAVIAFRCVDSAILSAIAENFCEGLVPNSSPTRHVPHSAET